MKNWFTNWVKKKIEIASKLNDGELGGGYAESMIILSAVISTLSSMVWPGDCIDRKRFIEILKEFTNTTPETTRISIPLFINELRNTHRNKEADILQNEFMNYGHTRVLNCNEVDKTEDEIIMICSNLNSQEIRKFSYANILYQEVRCNYVHEYNSGKRADPFPMTRKNNACVSYTNWVNNPYHHIHFHFDWIKEIVLTIAKALDNFKETLPLKYPESWWIEGKNRGRRN